MSLCACGIYNKEKGVYFSWTKRKAIDLETSEKHVVLGCKVSGEGFGALDLRYLALDLAHVGAVFTVLYDGAIDTQVQVVCREPKALGYEVGLQGRNRLGPLIGILLLHGQASLLATVGTMVTMDVQGVDQSSLYTVHTNDEAKPPHQTPYLAALGIHERFAQAYECNRLVDQESICRDQLFVDMHL